MRQSPEHEAFKKATVAVEKAGLDLARYWRRQYDQEYRNRAKAERLVEAYRLIFPNIAAAGREMVEGDLWTS